MCLTRARFLAVISTDALRRTDLAKRKRDTTPQSIKKRIKQGRGIGRLADYQPWLHIQDVPSLGLACRSKGWKTDRVHHFLSLFELRYFYAQEWSTSVVDIREQFPLLPLEETISIAANCGIPHPVHPRTKHPIVLTTDFVITLRVVSTDFDLPKTLKHKADLCSWRTLAKLELERRYWEVRKKKLKIVTEDNVPKVLAKNVEWVHPYRYVENFSELEKLEFSLIASNVLQAVRKQQAPLCQITRFLDNRLGVEMGTCLSITRHLIANRHLLVDMMKPINPSEPLNLL
jgi:hypothetical protein